MKSNQESITKNTHIRVKVKLNPTEDQIMVENSMRNMMGEKITIKKTEDSYLVVEDDLDALSKINRMIVKNELEELTENILEKNYSGESTCFFINKQSACNNSFHMIDENMSPLGDIEVKIMTDSPLEVIEWITS